MDGNDYKVRLEIFEGPLDLLLYLIKKEEVDIQEISIARITGQYLKYIETFRMLNIDLAAEFIVMAANLMYLKSRTLLPRQEQPPDDEAEEDDPRWELIRQLIEYKKFKDAASILSRREIEQADRFALQPEKPEVDPEPPPLAEVSIFDLIRAFQNVLNRFEESHELGDIIDDRFTVADKIEMLLGRFTRPGDSCRFEELFEDASTKAEVIVTFLAVLELMKMNQFILRQHGVFGEIEIERRGHAAATDALETFTEAGV